ncbi:MAG: hypothetical protein EA394_02900 [Bacteroidia bacterium]|nr:MAG: hypothetical protein EA394_02900 [Bacteroidia bacterium]
MKSSLSYIMLWLSFSIVFQGYGQLTFLQEKEEEVFYFRHITRENGLPSNVVRFVTQDFRGYLWIGTDNGLVRYDGHQTRVFRNDPEDPASLSEDVIHTIYESTDSLLWVGTGRGFAVYDPYRETFTNYHARTNAGRWFPDVEITRFWEDEDGSIWIGSHNGLHHYIRTQDQIVSMLLYDTAKGARENLRSYVNNISAFPHRPDTLIVGTQGGLLLVDKNSYEVIQDLNADWKERAAARAFFFEGDSLLWIGDWAAGLKRLNLQTLEWKIYDFPISPLDIAPKNSDALWLATPNMGLVVFNKKDESFTPHGKSEDNPRSLLSNYLQCNIFIDRQNNLWVGGKEGLNMLDRSYKSFRKIQLPYGLEDARCFYRDKAAGKTYFGTNDQHNIVFWDENKNEWGIVPDQTPGVGPYAGIRHMYRDHRGVIWATSMTNNLLYIDPDTQHLTMFLDRNGGPVTFRDGQSRLYHMAEDMHHNLWISAPFDGIIQLDADRKEATYFRYLPGVRNGLFRSQRYLELMVDHKNRLWIGSYDGFGVYDIDRGMFLSGRFDALKDMGLWGHGAGGFATDSLQRIWVCLHRKGLLRISEENNGFSFKRYHTIHGLNDPNVSRIAVDSKSNFWIINEGLVFFNPYTEQMNAFDDRNGLHKWKSLDDRIYIDEDDQIFLTGQGGFETNMIAGLALRGSIVNLLIEQVEINGSEIFRIGPEPQTRAATFRPSEKNFKFNFSAICFEDVHQIKYEYKLLGFDELPATVTSRGLAHYTNLPPGKYQFVVRAAHRGVWFDREAGFEFVIKPYYYQTIWFRMGSLASVILLLTAFIHIRGKQIRTREKVKSNFAKRIAEAEMQSLRAQMNPHFIFNSLNSINTFILKNETDEASDYLTKFSRLIRIVLNNSKNTLVSLEDELEALTIYLELEQIRFSNKFEFAIIIDQFLDTNRVFVPPLLLQPYVENALWHGLMHKEGRGRIDISALKNGEYVMFTIQDNGVGRKKSAECKSAFELKGKSLGMTIMAERISTINALYGSDAKVTITDLYDTNQRAAGTRVGISLPILTNAHN